MSRSTRSRRCRRPRAWRSSGRAWSRWASDAYTALGPGPRIAHQHRPEEEEKAMRLAMAAATAAAVFGGLAGSARAVQVQVALVPGPLTNQNQAAGRGGDEG